MSYISVKEAVTELLCKSCDSADILSKVNPSDLITVLHAVELVKGKLEKQNGVIMPGTQTSPTEGTGTNMGAAASLMSVGMPSGSLMQSDQQWRKPDKGLLDKHEGVIPKDHPDRPKMAILINVLHSSGRHDEAKRLYDKHIVGSTVNKLEWTMKGDVPSELKKEPFNTSDKRKGVLIDKSDGLPGSTSSEPMDGF
jgi:hypothetical protein